MSLVKLLSGFQISCRLQAASFAKEGSRSKVWARLKLSVLV